MMQPPDQLQPRAAGAAAYQDLARLVGNTPVVEVRNLEVPGRCRLFLKMESQNPSGSIKDRAAFAIVSRAQCHGFLRQGGSIVESTSGNFGKALALIGAAGGYAVILLVDSKTPPATVAYCSGLGAQLRSVATSERRRHVQVERVAIARALAASTAGAFWPDQYANPANPAVHETTTAVELLANPGEFDAVVAAVSTGGHVTGIGRGVKSARPNVEVVAVDASGSQALGGPSGSYRMRGIGLAWTPGNLDTRVVDLVQRVEDAEAFATCRVLARTDGIMVGESGGAVVFASLAYAASHPDRRIIGIIADGAEPYLVGGVFDDAWVAAAVGSEALEMTVDELVTAAAGPTHAAVDVARGRTTAAPAEVEERT
jgi:cystathionine beta-synthase/cysteine synthase A